VALNLMRRLDDLKASLDRISPRERVMLAGLAFAVVFGIIFIVGYIIFSGLENLEERNAAMRNALKDLDANRECYLEHRRQTAKIEVRMSRAPLELNRFVETAASAVGVSISESGEINPITADTFTQRGVEIKLRKITITQLAKLLKELESSPHIVQITRLNVHTRWNQHQDLDVEMTVTTYERKQEQTADKAKRLKT
jgi:type II secretory pathway component PulM